MPLPKGGDVLGYEIELTVHLELVYNRRLLAAARGGLPPEMEFEEWDGLERIPAYSEDIDVAPVPAAVDELRGALALADAA